LSVIRQNHNIPLSKVCDGICYVRSKLGIDRPLIAQQFKTNSIDLFVEHASHLLNVSKQGQEALRGDSLSPVSKEIIAVFLSGYPLSVAALRRTQNN
jgi:hypothetical protein